MGKIFLHPVCLYMMVLRFSITRALLKAYAARRVREFLVGRSTLPMHLVLNALTESTDSRFSAALIELLLSLPDPLLESSEPLRIHFDENILPQKAIRDRIIHCQNVLLVCFRP